MTVELGELVGRHHAATVAWVAGRVLRSGGVTYDGARDRAEDAVQDAWATLAARGLRAEDRFPGLLMRIALRAWGETLRRQSVARSNDGEVARDRSVDPGWGAVLTPAGVEEVRGLAGRCETCRAPLEGMQASALFCTARCKVRASRARKARARRQAT